MESNHPIVGLPRPAGFEDRIGHRPGAAPRANLAGGRSVVPGVDGGVRLGGMARNDSLRAADADRDEVAERLRKAAVDGRIDADELEDRLHLALRARTYGELRRLVSDLPVARRRARRPRSPVLTVLFAAALAVAMIVVAVLVLALIALVAAWWVVWILVWFTLRSRRRCVPMRGAYWLRPRRPSHLL